MHVSNQEKTKNIVNMVVKTIQSISSVNSLVSKLAAMILINVFKIQNAEISVMGIVKNICQV